MGLLLTAIEYLNEKENIKHIYFEGNINSYTYADDGASLYDVLNLYNGQRRLIKDKLIMAMKNIYELEEYIDKTDDVQLAMMVEIVKKYGNDIPRIIKGIEDKHLENNEKGKAEIIFSTVHRSKGIEYDTVQLVNDFITEEKIKKLKEDKGEFNLAKLNEEINLLYVAATRTKNNIYIPETLIPFEFPDSQHVIPTKLPKKDEKAETIPIRQMSSIKVASNKKVSLNEKKYSVEKTREKYKDAFTPWTDAQDDKLTIMYCEGANIKEMATNFGRTSGAIRSRVKKLELKELYGER